jgi:hypothetical protein
LVCAALVALGCGPTRPAQAPLLPREVTVYVAVTDQVAKTDQGNVAAMVDAIETDLREEQHAVTIVAARSDEAPPPVRLEVQVMSSSSGDASVRGAGQLAGFFSGVVDTAVALSEAGTVLADAYIVRGGGRPVVYLGRMESSSTFAVSEEAIAAGTRLGHFIAWRALHGPPPSEPSNLR